MTAEINWKACADIYAEGGFDVNVAKELGITIAAFYQLEQEQPAFAKFIEKGRTLSKAWWYDQARKGVWSKGFNTPLFNFVMKNQHGWADKMDVSDTTDKDPVNLDEAKGQLAARLKVLEKSNPELLGEIRRIQGDKK